MVLKALFLLIILYFIIRASNSLLRALRNDSGPRPRSELHREPPRPAGRERSAESSSKSDENVEDAKWVDL